MKNNQLSLLLVAIDEEINNVVESYYYSPQYSQVEKIPHWRKKIHQYVLIKIAEINKIPRALPNQSLAWHLSLEEYIFEAISNLLRENLQPNFSQMR